MPEGPEVAVLADVARKGIGKKFINSEIVENVPQVQHRFSKNGILRLNEIQKPWVLSSVGVKGKLIYLGMQTETGLITGLLTFGMSGSLAWGQKHHKHARIAFLAESGLDLVFVDARNFGTFRLKTPEEADEILDDLGWDLLHSPAPDDLWASFQKSSKIKNKVLKVALLDQSLYCGIGNYLACEIMGLLNLNPRSVVESFPPEKWMQINYTAHKIMQDSYKQGGASIEAFFADGKTGSYQFSLKFYGQKKCPEGHLISKIKQGERSTWLCEVCQA